MAALSKREAKDKSLKTISPLPPPRVVRMHRKSGAIGFWLGRLIIFPHTCIGIGLAGLFLLKITLGLFGTRIDGQLENAKRKTGSKGGVDYHLSYSFFADQQRYHGKSQVSSSDYLPVEKNNYLPLVYLPILPAHASDFLPQGAKFPHKTWHSLGFASLWNGLLSVFIYFLYISPYRQKKLLKYGVETTARVTKLGMEYESNGRPVRRTTYSYEVAGVKYQKTESLSKEIAPNLNSNMPLRIVYDPAKPKRAMAIDHSLWEVVA